MGEKKANQVLIRAEIKRLKGLCASSREMLGRREMATSLFMARQVLKDIPQLPDMITSLEGYENLPLDKKFSDSFEKFKGKKLVLESLTEADLSSPSMVSRLLMIEDLSRINLYLDLMAQEVDYLFPPFKVTNWFLFKYKKTVLAAVLLIIAGFSINAYLKKDQGLTGYYYWGTNFESFFRKRIDKAIAFNWGWGSAFIDYRADHISVRWKGSLVVDKPGKYEFKVLSDDGAVLYVNGEKLIDAWYNRYWAESVGTIELKAGKFPIQLDYFEFNYGSGVFLYWRSSPDQPFEVIPTENLRVDKP